MVVHGLLLAWMAVVPAAAQPGASASVLESRNVAERNQLGLLQYCRDQGLIGDDAVRLQRQLVARLPAVPGADMEAAGRRGELASGTRRTTIAESAAAQGATLRFGCEQAALRVLRQEAGQ